MKAFIRLTFTAFAFSAMISNTACTKSSSSDDGGGGGGGTAQSALTLASGSVPAGGTATLMPTGGTPPYQFTLQTTIGGSVYASLDGLTATLTAGNTAGLVGITVTDKNGSTAQASYTVTASATLTVTPLTSTVAPGATVTYIVSGGSAPYTYTATAGTFSGAVFTAPSTAQTVTVTISDSAGHSTQATVTVQGTSATASCSGNYNLNLAGYPGTLVIVANSSGTIAGYLQLTGYGGPAAISGTCANGNINFTDLYSNDPYTGTYFVNPSTNKNVITGTFTDAGSTYGWFATQQ